jgi:hypothetical protein
MEQLGRGAGRRLGQIAHFGQNNGHTPTGGIAGNPAAIDAPTDHEQIDRAALGRMMHQICPPRRVHIQGRLAPVSIFVFVCVRFWQDRACVSHLFCPFCCDAALFVARQHA